MQNRPARSVGKLTIGDVIYAEGVVSVEMLFESVCNIGEDEIQSASLQVAKSFDVILKRNGYWNHGRPETKITQFDKRTIHFLVAVQAKAGADAPYVIRTQ